MADSKTPVLIVGAGPTGMMLSLWLDKFSVPHRIIDGAATSGMTSRALVMHARPLEFYRQLGLASAMISKGTQIENFVTHHNSIQRGVIPAAESGRGLSNYPFILSITQDEHEALQQQTLLERGVKVERGTSFVSMTPHDSSVEVTMRNAAGAEEKLTAGYVVGCDGAHSPVRHSANIEMQGGTYDRAFFVADVLHSGKPSTQAQMNMCLSSEDFLMVIPMPHQQGRARLIGFVPKQIEATRPDDVTFDDVRTTVLRNAKDIGVERVNWFSRYKVHHRVASTFKQGRVFLCGDAAHIHSPVGGQGMNTGLGDATNLAWKLAAVLNQAAPATLLDSYGLEREPFAHKLVNTTDAMFMRLTGDSFLSLFLRNFIVPHVAPVLIRLIGLGPTVYKRISQIEIEYRSSPLSANHGPSDGKAARAGDRLPWIEHVEGSADKLPTDNFAALEASVWQAHVYGKAPAWAEAKLAESGVTLHVFPWVPATMTKAGLRQGVLYLVRPDGHIGLVLGSGNEAELDRYMAKWAVGAKKAP